MSENRIYTLAFDLSKKMHECLHNEIEAGRFSRIATRYVKFEVISYDYERGIAFPSSSFFAKKAFVLKRLRELQSSFEQLPAYKHFLSEMIQSNVSKEDAVKFLQRDFIPNIMPVIMADIENETLNKENVERSINKLLGDLLGYDLRWDVSIWIKGIRIKDDIGEKTVELGRGLSLRRPNPSDFAYELLEGLRPYLAPNIFDTVSNVPDAILELHLGNVRRSDGYTEVKKRIERPLECLSLYKLGAIYAIKTELRPESFTQKTEISRLASFRHVSPHTYDIGLEDISRLKLLIDQIEKWLSTTRSRKNERSAADIAIERYRDALLAKESATSIEHSIASAVMCLEAIYSIDKAELGHRVSLRVSAVLRHFAFDPLTIYNVMRCAYEIRSIFAHGAMLSAKQKTTFKGCGSAQEIADSVLEYARISILTYLAITHSTRFEKKRYVDIIDRAIIDAKGDAEISNAVIRVSAVTPIR